MKCTHESKVWRRIWHWLILSSVPLVSLKSLVMSQEIGAENYGLDDYGEGDLYGDGAFDGSYDPYGRGYREDMMTDIDSQRTGYPNELSTKTKKFKLFEKRRLTHEKAKAFCKKREGKLAQAMNVDEMHRLQMLLMKGTSLASNVWVGADKREWKRHSSKMLGIQPNLPANAMIMGGGPTVMCPAMSISTRSLTPAECFKEFPFICEFPPGKGKAPVKSKKKKITKKDEMRRKRELSPGVVGSHSGSTGAASLIIDTTTPDVEHFTTDKNSEVLSQTTEDVAESDLENARKEHEIGFDPHVMFSATNLPGNGIDISTLEHGTDADENGLEPSMGTVAHTGGDSLGKPVTTSTGEIDPDQQMLDLFDEQLENMRKIVQPESKSTTIKPRLNKKGRSIGKKKQTYTGKNLHVPKTDDATATELTSDAYELKGEPTESFPAMENHTEEISVSDPSEQTTETTTDVNSNDDDEATTSESDSLSETTNEMSIGTSKITFTNEIQPTTMGMFQNRSTTVFSDEGSNATVTFKGLPILNRLVAG